MPRSSQTKDLNFSRLAYRIGLLGLASMSLAACVTVGLPSRDVRRAEGVRFRAPGPPFEPMRSNSADQGWINRASGSSISYHSDCRDSEATITLESAQSELLAGLSMSQPGISERREFQGRAALWTEALGQLEGVPTAVSALIFIRNGCLYTITWVRSHRMPQSEGDRPVFEAFLSGFRAP